MNGICHKTDKMSAYECNKHNALLNRHIEHLQQSFTDKTLGFDRDRSLLRTLPNYFIASYENTAARCSVDGWDSMYAISRKVAGSTPDETNELFQFT
jgi:hypothetical protein